MHSLENSQAEKKFSSMEISICIFDAILDTTNFMMEIIDGSKRSIYFEWIAKKAELKNSKSKRDNIV